MFGFLRKKEAPTPASDSAADKMAEQIKEQTEIAELQSQIAELRHRSAQMNSEVLRKLDERAQLMAEIPTAPAAKKVALARRVQNIDKYVAGLNASLALIEQQIGNNEAIILQKGNTGIVKAGKIENVVDLGEHQKDLQEAADAKRRGDVDVQIAEDMNADLVGDAMSVEGDSALAGILAEAEGAAPPVPVFPTEPEAAKRPPNPMQAGQY